MIQRDVLSSKQMRMIDASHHSHFTDSHAARVCYVKNATRLDQLQFCQAGWLYCNIGRIELSTKVAEGLPRSLPIIFDVRCASRRALANFWSPREHHFSRHVVSTFENFTTATSILLVIVHKVARTRRTQLLHSVSTEFPFRAVRIVASVYANVTQQRGKCFSTERQTSSKRRKLVIAYRKLHQLDCQPGFSMQIPAVRDATGSFYDPSRDSLEGLN